MTDLPFGVTPAVSVAHKVVAQVIDGPRMPGAIVVPMPGRDGDSMRFDGFAATYAELPATGVEHGDMYLVLADKLGYVWDDGWLPEGEGIEILGVPGDPGRGYTSVVIAGNSLVFTRTDGATETVPVPALAAAAAAAGAAAGSADAAAGFAGAAQGHAQAAAESADEAASYVGQPADGSVTTPKIAENAVTNTHIAPGSLEQDRLQPTGPFTDALATKADLDNNGKVLAAQIPAEALTEFLTPVPASQAAMLALDGQRGDWTLRSDLGTEWVLIGEPSSVLANWRERTTPASPVSSVNGRTGAVDTSSADITDSGAAGRALMKAATPADARMAIGAGTSNLAVGAGAGDAMAGNRTAGAIGGVAHVSGQAGLTAGIYTEAQYAALSAAVKNAWGFIAVVVP